LSKASAALGGEPVAGRERTGGTDPLARTVFGLLVLACFAAFFVTQRLKHTPTPVQKFHLTPVFSPTPAGRIKQEGISFKLDHADTVSVAIIDADGNVVATLVRDRPLPRYKQFSLRWSGRRGLALGDRTTATATGRPILVPILHGPVAPAGEYRVKVTLRNQSKSILSPRSFTLVRP
jgi:hypothetical protein